MKNKIYKEEENPIQEDRKEKEVELPGKSQSLKVELETNKSSDNEIQSDAKENVQ